MPQIMTIKISNSKWNLHPDRDRETSKSVLNDGLDEKWHGLGYCGHPYSYSPGAQKDTEEHACESC